MNRAEMLRVSLMSWLGFKEVSKIIVVDWSSSDLSDNFIKFICSYDDRICFKRVDGKSVFSLAEAVNLGVSLVDTEFMLKLDVDYVLNPYYNFFEINKLGAGEFLSGDWRWHCLDNNLGFLKYLNGLLYVRTADFRAGGGYDERFTGYGYEDTDLYHRLAVKLGLAHRYIDINVLSVYHNVHDDSKRVENYVEKDVCESMRRNFELFKRNKFS